MRHKRSNGDLTDADLAAIRAVSPWWNSLTTGERDRLRALTTRFLEQKRFEGTKGFTPTRNMQVVISAHACLLVLGLDLDWYRDVSSVLIGPHVVDRTGPRHVDGGIIHDGHVWLSGQAMLHGPVLITWDVVHSDVVHPERGHNVVFHEFAHKIDMRSGAATGEPPLTRELAERWHHVMGTLLADLRRHPRGELDSYAATNPAELMAVCTEAFFTIPRTVRSAYPDLYDLFRSFYQQDPAAR